MDETLLRAQTRNFRHDCFAVQNELLKKKEGDG